MPVATFRYTDEYFLEAQMRFKHQSRGTLVARWVLVGYLLLTFLGAVCLGVYSDTLGQTMLTLLPIGGVVAIAFPFRGRLERWLTLHAFRQSSSRNQLVRVEIGADGCRMRGAIISADFAWAAFIRVVQFRDGFLLFQGPKSIYWIPARYLEDAAAVAELEALLDDNIEEHTVIEPVVWEKPQDAWD